MRVLHSAGITCARPTPFGPDKFLDAFPTSGQVILAMSASKVPLLLDSLMVGQILDALEVRREGLEFLEVEGRDRVMRGCTASWPRCSHRDPALWRDQ